MDDRQLLSTAALTTFRLNGQFLGVADKIARPAGISAAWWQVLGAVLAKPLPVAGIARVMGITRQSVQRIADLLVERGLVEYRDNPAHRRARLVAPTPLGLDVVRAIRPGHARLAKLLSEELGVEELQRCVDALARLSQALDEVTPSVG